MSLTALGQDFDKEGSATKRKPVAQRNKLLQHPRSGSPNGERLAAVTRRKLLLHTHLRVSLCSRHKYMVTSIMLVRHTRKD